MRYSINSINRILPNHVARRAIESRMWLSVVFFLAIAGWHGMAVGQEQDFVEDEGVTSPLHKEHTGEIIFTPGLIPFDSYKESDFLTSFKVTPDSDLAFTAFFDASLTNHLHQLDSTLSADELVQSGNFQFSFFVDDALIYTENLNLGAGLPSQKNTHTVLVGPLQSTRQEDYWSRFLWTRFFVRGGGEDALADGEHELRIEIRPYLDLEGDIKVGELMAKGQIQISLPEPEAVGEDQVAIQEIAEHRDWKRSSASFNEDLIRQLNRKIAQRRIKDVTSIVVVKDGDLLIEEYFNGASRSTLHDTRSVGKTFASAITGIAIAEGHLSGTDQTLGDFYDVAEFHNHSAAKERVTLKSLLTMSSGIDGSDQDQDSPGNENYMYPTDNWVKFALDLPMDSSKSTEKSWDYFTAGVVVLGDVLHKSVPGGLESFAEARLFAPLGITEYQWPYTPQGVAGTAGGLEMSALDFAKFGQLYKNGGSWNGKQVLPASWVKESLTNYFPPTGNHAGYGYLFWRQVFTIDGQDHEAFLCSGNGGNKIYIFSDLPLVIVVTATAYNQMYAHSQVKRMMQQLILPAVIER